MEQFEKNIKEKLNERKIYPSAQAWDKLEMMLNAEETKSIKKKSPRTLLFIAASLLAFVSLGTFFFKINSTSVELNQMEILPSKSLVVEENQEEQIHEVLEEEKIPSNEISESKIIKAKSENKAIAQFPEVERIVLNEVEVYVNKEIVVVEENKQIADVISEEKKEISSQKVDPKKLLIVAEYEKNVEKSASQFKQMKEKFQEVKTALHNINE